MRTSADGRIRFLIADHHGTNTLSIASPDLSFNRRKQLPYGAERGTPPAAWPSQKGFVGGDIDKTTNLTHIGAREYDTKLGQFISVDPLLVLDSPQSLNGYNYANNNPITTADSTGMCAEADCPTRPCPNCENTTPGETPGPITLTHVGRKYGPGLTRDQYQSAGGGWNSNECNGECSEMLDLLGLGYVPPGPN